jgi:hypothetical protein
MVNRIEKIYNSVMVIQRSDYKWGIIDLDGNIIVPFGKYDWIDGFDQGLARVKIGRTPSNQVDNDNKWGIINERGEEVLPVEYDEIWNFLGKNRYSTKVVKDGVKKDVYLHDLNPSLPVRGMVLHTTSHDEYDDYDDYGTHYGEFAGTYAQDVAGFSDDVINDAFEGDPDAYWNID